MGVWNDYIKNPRERHVAETLELWSLSDGKLAATLRSSTAPVREGGTLSHFAFSGDGRIIAACDRAGRVHVWRVPQLAP